jgi:succinate dehydrogenase/fumarate reductase flavoprotein subunit
MATNTNVVTLETDVLVIGAGWAGFFAAIKAKEAGANVIMVDKGFASRSGASSMNDGHVTVYNEEWGASLDAWKRQHAELGEYMNNPEWTEISCLESYVRYKDILEWGIKPPLDDKGELIHPFGEPRYKNGVDAIWIGWGNTTMPFVRKHALKIGVNIVDRVHITDLVKNDGVINGAVGFSTQNADFYVFKAKATVLATGSSSFKTHLHAALGQKSSFDGEAMAYRAGAAISGMEFASMSRWMPYVGEWPADSPTYSRKGRKINDCYTRNVNWVFGGPTVIAGNYTDADGKGDGFVHPYGLMAVHEGKGPLLQDLGHVSEEEMQHALRLYEPDYERFNSAGIDPTERGLFSGPFTVAEAFLGRHMGGAGGITSTDLNGGTTLPGLFGAGDSYHSGVSGAVYPSGGTGIRVAMTTGARSGMAAYKYSNERKTEVSVDEKELDKLREFALGPIQREGGFDPEWVSSQVTNIIVPYYIFGVRSGERLKAALTLLEFHEKHVAPQIYVTDAHYLDAAQEVRSRIFGAKMMVSAALFREESRGLQYREDFPNRDDENWLCHVVIEQKDGEMTLSKKPIDEWFPDLKDKPYLEKYPNRYRGEVLTK